MDGDTIADYVYIKTFSSVFGTYVFATSDAHSISAGTAGVAVEGVYVDGVETTIIGSGLGALGKAEKIENYYGFAEPVDAKELVAAGIAQAKRAGVNYIEDEVVGIGFGQKLVVSTKTNSYEADYVVLSTGASRSTPPIPGLREL